MNIIITEWALNSYIELHHKKKVFNKKTYNEVLRPDAKLLKKYPHDPKFNLSSFWSPAKSPPGKMIRGGFKMKWDSIGNGNVELRLPIKIQNDIAYLCSSYVKNNSVYERRMLAKFKTRSQLIEEGRMCICGKI